MKTKTKIGTTIAILLITAGTVGGFAYQGYAQTTKENNAEQKATVALRIASKTPSAENLTAVQRAISAIQDKSVNSKDTKKLNAIKTEKEAEAKATQLLSTAQTTDSAGNIDLAEKAIAKVSSTTKVKAFTAELTALKARVKTETEATSAVNAFVADNTNATKLATANASLAKLTTSYSNTLKTSLTKQVTDAQAKATADAQAKASSAKASTASGTSKAGGSSYSAGNTTSTGSTGSTYYGNGSSGSTGSTGATTPASNDAGTPVSSTPTGPYVYEYYVRDTKTQAILEWYASPDKNTAYNEAVAGYYKFVSQGYSCQLGTTIIG